ncbi:hypothetical protein K438DRAFT_1827348 [Mycena galopus ATCC 62051]|nr:hypothetical protein K438DRAFT_1827348 [Mycena galopus ATCC 62051]
MNLLIVTLFIATLNIGPTIAQSSNITDTNPCDPTCNPINDAVIGDPTSTTCTNAIALQYAQCLDCEDRFNDDDLVFSSQIITCTSAFARMRDSI